MYDAGGTHRDIQQHAVNSRAMMMEFRSLPTHPDTLVQPDNTTPGPYTWTAQGANSEKLITAAFRSWGAWFVM